jgi:hypothetical protein
MPGPVGIGEFGVADAGDGGEDAWIEQAVEQLV